MNVVSECANIAFGYAPVMMHSINEKGGLVEVNQCWLATMGYELTEVLGRKSIDFLTEESRAQAMSETLPLFWQAGRAHSVGYEIVRKNGRVLDVLLDAYIIQQHPGERVALATLCQRDHHSQWLLASTVLRTQLGLNRVQRILYGFLRPTETDEPEHRTAGVQVGSPTSHRIPKAEDLKEVLRIAQQISFNLHIAANLEEQRRHTLTNKQQELLLLAQTVEIAVAELAADTKGS